MPYYRIMKKYSVCLILFLVIGKIVHAQWDRGGSLDYDDEEIRTIEDVGVSIVVGLIFAVVGYILMQIKAVNGLGKVLVGLGLIVAAGSIVVYLLQIVGMLLSVALSFALKVALVIGAFLLVISILKGIYEWLTK
jgi:hypothetical protein